MSFSGALSLLPVVALLGLVGIQSILVLAINDDNSGAPERLKLTIYYETLCPDSKRFIYNNLYPAMINNGWLSYVELDFVPYGKVAKWVNPNTNEVYLSCQHGLRECELNAVHACIVEHNTEREQLDMINCMMLNSRKSIDQCALENGVNVDAAKTCKATRSVSDILHIPGQRTDAIEISFVPSTGFDGIFRADEQSNVFYDFDATFCSHYKQKFNKIPNHC